MYHNGHNDSRCSEPALPSDNNNDCLIANKVVGWVGSFLYIIGSCMCDVLHERTKMTIPLLVTNLIAINAHNNVCLFLAEEVAMVVSMNSYQTAPECPFNNRVEPTCTCMEY